MLGNMLQLTRIPSMGVITLYYLAKKRLTIRLTVFLLIIMTSHKK